jgi:hypothetical protein
VLEAPGAHRIESSGYVEIGRPQPEDCVVGSKPADVELADVIDRHAGVRAGGTV